MKHLQEHIVENSFNAAVFSFSLCFFGNVLSEQKWEDDSLKPQDEKGNNGLSDLLLFLLSQRCYELILGPESSANINPVTGMKAAL